MLKKYWEGTPLIPMLQKIFCQRLTRSTSVLQDEIHYETPVHVLVYVGGQYEIMRKTV